MISQKYANFVDILSSILVFLFIEDMQINNHAINLIDDQQSLYKSIYSLEQI